MSVGKVILVGAGPGDAGLFTLKGKEVLERADVVVYDSLVGPGVLGLMPDGAEKIDVGKRAGNHPVPQPQINQILLDKALEGKLVVRLKGGDPFLFGRGGEELELLRQHDVPFEVVSGVTSALSVPAYNGIPVTHRDFVSSLHIITGHTRKQPGASIDYEALVRLKGTLVFLMGISAMEGIMQGLMQAGMPADMPAAVLERGTTAHQRRVVSTVEHLWRDSQQADIKTPAIIVVGEVCRLAEEFHWAEDRPLGGKKIVVTRPKDRAGRLSSRLRTLGAEVVELPAIRTCPVENNDALMQALAQPDRYDVIALTSPAGVTYFFDALRRSRMDIRSLAGIRFAAIGSATREAIEQRGIQVEIMPSTYSAQYLAQAIAEALPQGGRVLLPRARMGTESLTEGLAQRGISYDDIPLYDTEYRVNEGLDAGAQAAEADYIAFTSASTVKGFAACTQGADYTAMTAVCIGEQTAAEARKLGMKIKVARQATMDSMIECMLEIKE
ncbi:MAG: uroporphyrinogen-III C-methyltransferase [Eubacteriales bacterium]|jgi:uroporphyrinogen III methyltransferase/synthase